MSQASVWSSPDFKGRQVTLNLNFPVENSNFSQFFVSDIHIHTFPHNFVEKKISFYRHFKQVTFDQNLMGAVLMQG